MCSTGSSGSGSRVPEPHLLLGGLARQQRHLVARDDPDVPLGELREAGVVEHPAPDLKPGRSSGGGAAGIASWCSMPLWSVWNDADIEKIVSPCWIALTRRVQNDPPSRSRSTMYTVGRPGVAGPQEVAVQRVHLELRVDGAHRRHQRLAGDVAAERALQETRIRG